MAGLIKFETSLETLQGSGFKPGQKLRVFDHRDFARCFVGTFRGFATDNKELSSAQVFIEPDKGSKTDWTKKVSLISLGSAEIITARRMAK